MTQTEAMVTLRSTRAQAGNCIECGKRPRSLRANGQLAQRCTECLQAANDAKRLRKLRAKGRPLAFPPPPEGPLRGLEDLSDAAEDAYYAQVDKRRVLVERVIRKSDKSNAHDESYRGMTLSEINRALGEDIDKTLTLAAVNGLELFTALLVPERYTYLDRRVKFVAQEQWGQVVKPPSPYIDTPYPEQATLGRRDK